MQFEIKRDILLKSLNFVQGVVEKKNTLPILSNVLLQLKNKKLRVVQNVGKKQNVEKKQNVGKPKINNLIKMVDLAYDLKDELIRQTIMDTQEDVEEIKETIDKIDERLYEIQKNGR